MDKKCPREFTPLEFAHFEKSVNKKSLSTRSIHPAMQGPVVGRCYSKNLDGLCLRCNQPQNRSMEKSILLRGSRRIRSCSAISSMFCGLSWLLGLTGLTGLTGTVLA